MNSNIGQQKISNKYREREREICGRETLWKMVKKFKDKVGEWDKINIPTMTKIYQISSETQVMDSKSSRNSKQ